MATENLERTEESRYVYLSLAENMNLMGIPVKTFFIIIGISAGLLILTGNWLGSIATLVVFMAVAKFISNDDQYNLGFIWNYYFKEKDKMDA